MGNRICRQGESNNHPSMTNDTMNDHLRDIQFFTRPSPSLFGFTQQADTSLGFAPFIVDRNLDTNIQFTQNHQPIDKLDQV